MTISKREFGILCDGTLVSCWTLKGENGLTAEILDYGVIIRSVVVPDKNGNPVDVVLGYDTLEAYVSDDCYLGATIGRVANRIKGASFQLNGKTYSFFVVFRNYLVLFFQIPRCVLQSHKNYLCINNFL